MSRRAFLWVAGSGGAAIGVGGGLSGAAITRVPGDGLKSITVAGRTITSVHVTSATHLAGQRNNGRHVIIELLPTNSAAVLSPSQLVSGSQSGGGRSGSLPSGSPPSGSTPRTPRPAPA